MAATQIEWTYSTWNPVAGCSIVTAGHLRDIPRLVTEAGDAISVMEFYESIYNFTPAHADDVNAAIIESTDR